MPERRKGQKLINGIVDSWMIDTGEIPIDREIITHILTMEDWEFDQHVNLTDCPERLSTLENINKRLEEEAAEKERLKREKEDKKYGHKRRTIQD